MLFFVCCSNQSTFKFYYAKLGSLGYKGAYHIYFKRSFNIYAKLVSKGGILSLILAFIYLHTMCMRSVKAVAWLSVSKGSSEHSLFAFAIYIKIIVSWTTSFHKCIDILSCVCYGHEQ